ncbi:hypothetical protein D3C86_1814960 [compost metagenome]
MVEHLGMEDRGIQWEKLREGLKRCTRILAKDHGLMRTPCKGARIAWKGLGSSAEPGQQQAFKARNQNESTLKQLS